MAGIISFFKSILGFLVEFTAFIYRDDYGDVDDKNN